MLAVNDPQNPLELLPICVRSWALYLVPQSTHCAFPPTDSPANSAWNLYPTFLAKLEIGIGGRYWPLVVVLLSVEVQVIETVSLAKLFYDAQAWIGVNRFSEFLIFDRCEIRPGITTLTKSWPSGFLPSDAVFLL